MPSTAKGMDKLGGNKVFIWGTGNYRLLVAILFATTLTTLMSIVGITANFIALGD